MSRTKVWTILCTFFPLKLVWNECGVVTRGPKDRPTLFLACYGNDDDDDDEDTCVVVLLAMRTLNQRETHTHKKVFFSSTWFLVIYVNWGQNSWCNSEIVALFPLFKLLSITHWQILHSMQTFLSSSVEKVECVSGWNCGDFLLFLLLKLFLYSLFF